MHIKSDTLLLAGLGLPPAKHGPEVRSDAGIALQGLIAQVVWALSCALHTSGLLRTSTSDKSEGMLLQNNFVDQKAC